MFRTVKWNWEEEEEEEEAEERGMEEEWQGLEYRCEKGNMCCSVLQCVAACCSLLQRVAVCCEWKGLE